MKNKFSIIILIAVSGLVVVVGGWYFVSNKLNDQKLQKIQDEEIYRQEKEQVRAFVASTTAEIENLKKELTDIKKKEIVAQKQASQTKIKLTNAEIIKKVKPAVVYIETQSGTGSGMLIDSDGYILTNAHVVAGVVSANISLQDGRVISATVVGRNEVIDLALLKILATNLPYAGLGDSTGVKQGDEVFTLGYPFGIKGDVSFKEGTISRRINDGNIDYFETSAELHPGNSGGPLVNREGKVIGINTAAFGQKLNIQGVEQDVIVGETIKLAIEINTAKEILDRLKGGAGILVWSKKATGKIMIYNEFSTAEQKLIINTRFESPDGRIYKLAQSITVPGKKIINQQEIPGQIEAVVIAEEEGSQYNIDPTKFTIPAFKGGPKYEYFYGISTDSITIRL